MKAPYENTSAHTSGIGAELFSLIAHTSPQPMLVANASAEILFVNVAWEREFGYTLAEVLGKNPRILQSGKTHTSVHRAMWQSLHAGKVFRTTSVIDRRKDGSLLNLRSTVFPVHASGGMYFVQILDNITDEKRTQSYQELFLKTAVHDLRSPLQSLQLMSDMALLDQSRERIKDIQSEIHRIAQLTNTLLDGEQFSAGQIILHISTFSAAKVLSEIVNRVRAGNRSVRIDVPNNLFITADQRRFEQVVTNLLDNALKYAGPSGVVSVSSKAVDSGALISVSDTGPGIPEHEMPFLFQPFYRTGSARSSAIAGTGLGLYTVETVVKAYGGTIDVESVLGKGTTFRFTIPDVKA